jgi:phosphoribosylformylglycinamidine synthase
LNIENKKTIFTRSFNGSVNKSKLVVPIAHIDGNYFCDSSTLAGLEENSQVVFRYEDNPNGSVNNIAGIVSKRGNVLGMMPHPERASEDLVGSHDGRHIFESIIQSLN